MSCLLCQSCVNISACSGPVHARTDLNLHGEREIFLFSLRFFVARKKTAASGRGADGSARTIWCCVAGNPMRREPFRERE